MVNETNDTKCKRCGIIKKRIYSGEKYPNMRDKKYFDETGHLWMGLVCPQCNRDRVRENQRKARDARQQQSNQQSDGNNS